MTDDTIFGFTKRLISANVNRTSQLNSFDVDVFE